MMTNRVCWHVNFNQENEYKECGMLIEVLKDKWGLYARIDDGGDGYKLCDLWRFDRESYLLCQRLYPHFWQETQDND